MSISQMIADSQNREWKRDVDTRALYQTMIENGNYSQTFQEWLRTRIDEIEKRYPNVKWR